MKRIYIALAVVATAALASCQQEKSFNDENLDENSVVFAIKNAATRSAGVDSEARQGIVIPLETEDGSRFVLEETVTSLDALLSETRGTPAYTENLGTLYANDLSVWGDKGSFTTEATYANMESSLYPRKDESQGDGWRYQHNYNGDPWPASGAVGFYLNMPAAPTGVSITDRTGGKFTFTYTSPTTAAEQQDILFAYRQMTKDEHKGFLPNGAPVLFNHALTGVKFAIANYDASKKITIKSISFNGLYDGGTCTITPDKENNYEDKPTEEYSSSDGRVVWDPNKLTKSGDAISSGNFGAPVAFQKKNGEEGGSFSSKGNYPDSFAEGGNTNNLNDRDASQTFWLIPQTMSDDVTLTIEYTCGSDTKKTGVFEFGKALKTASGYVEWKAGELRTYTIKVDDVNVSITDQFTTSTKNNVVITNTGATEAYIRAAIIGQWVDPSGNPVFGYTDFKTGDESGQPATIPSWYQDYINDGTYYGSFVKLPGDDWVKGSDGYYYYKKPVASGATTTALFTSYTINETNRPIMKVGGIPTPTNLLIDIATQAIAAKQKGSGNTLTYIPYDEAWANAKDVASKAQTLTVN